MYDDVGGTYFEDADILCDGRFYLLWERTVTFDLTEPFEGSPSLGPFNATGNVGIEIPDTSTNTTGLLGMAIGETAQTTKVQFNFVVGNTRYFLRLGSNYTLDTADVTRTGANTWVVEASSTDRARLLSCPARGTCKVPGVGDYHVLFQMTLVAEP